MKRYFFSFLSALCICFSAMAVTLPTHTSFINQFFLDSDAEPTMGFMDIDIRLKFMNEPDTSWGIYAMQFFRFANGSSAYTGLQVDPNGKRAIFSVWDSWYAGAKASPAHPNCQRFSHEGNGTMCFYTFNWKAGIEYKIHVVKTFLNDKTTDGREWSAYIIDTTTGEKNLIGVIDFGDTPAFVDSNGAVLAPSFVGYGNIHHSTFMNTLEYYMGNANATCNQLGYAEVQWRGPFANNDKYKPVYAYNQYNTGVGTDCNNEDVSKVLPFTISQKTGANTVQVTKDFSELVSAQENSYYNVIDCFYDWAQTQYPSSFYQPPLEERIISNFTKEGNYWYYTRSYKDVHGVPYSIKVNTTDSSTYVNGTNMYNMPIGNIVEIGKVMGCYMK